MKTISVMMVGLLISMASLSEAALKTFAQKNKLTIIEDGVTRYQTIHQDYAFRMEIISDNEGLKTETTKQGYPFVAARPEERYSIRLYNPLPVRVAVNLTVDGLNSLTGEPSGISDGSKWMIDPYSYITIRGWQVSQGEARRFFFTETPRTYAVWRGEQMNKNLAVNCGVIGAAFFWNKQELQSYFDCHPEYRYKPVTCGEGGYRGSTGVDMKKSMLAAPSARENKASNELRALSDSQIERNEKAGTGMGEREPHATQYVDFRYDTGMYKASQALVIYYDFAKEPTPNPFPGLSYAPEMP